MLKQLLIALVVTLAMPFNQLYSCDIHGRTGIVEDNDLWIGPHDKGINSMTEQEFNNVISKIETIYKPLVRDKGGDLHVERKWDDGTVNASAQRFSQCNHTALYTLLQTCNVEEPIAPDLSIQSILYLNS